MDGRLRVALKVCGAEGEDVLAVLSFSDGNSTRVRTRSVKAKGRVSTKNHPDLRNAIIRQSTIIHPLQRPIQRLQAKIRPRTPRNKRILQILLALPLRPLDALGPPILTQIRAFGEHHQPHWLQRPLTAIVPTRQLAEPAGEARGVSLHISRHEDEPRQAKAEPDERNVQDRFLENDINVPVGEGAIGIGGPPEVDPIIVQLQKATSASAKPTTNPPYLMISNQHRARSKAAPQPPIPHPANLPLDALIPTHMHRRRRPPLRHGQHQQRHTLLRKRREAIVVIPVDQIQRGPDILRDSYAANIHP